MISTSQNKKKHSIFFSNARMLIIMICFYSIIFSSCSTIKNISDEQDQLSISTVNTSMLKQEQIIEDIDQFLAGINSASPFIYNEIDSLEIIQYANFIKSKKTATYNEFFLDFRKLVSMFQMSHLYLNWPYWYLKDEFSKEGQGILPLALTYNKDSLRWEIASSDDPDIIVNNGDRLARINGYSADSLINKYFNYVPGPKVSRYYTFENGAFSLLLYLAGIKAPYEIEIIRNGKTFSYTVQGFDPFASSATNSSYSSTAYSDYISNFIDYQLLDNETGIVRLKSFNIYFDKKIEKQYRRILEKAVHEFNANGISRVIIDLRGNSGGSSVIANLAIRYFLKAPIKFQDNSFLKMSPEWSSFIDRHPRWIRLVFNTIYAPGFFKLEYGEIYHQNRSKKIKPMGNSLRFNGEVYIAINQLTASAALYLADQAQFHKVAKLIGEPTSDLPSEHTNLIYFRTKNSGISYSLPTIYGVRANGDPNDNLPLMPDIFIETRLDDLKDGVDPIIEYFKTK